MSDGMGGHHLPFQGKNDEWLTPPWLLEKLGNFDLDPCAPVVRPWPTAAEHFTVEDDGLSKPWHGRVWCNPPYGQKTGVWLEKLAAHGNGLALIFAMTETEMFFVQVWEKASAVLFLRGRLFFHYVGGERAASNSGAPSCLVAYGSAEAERLAGFGLSGQFVRLR